MNVEKSIPWVIDLELQPPSLDDNRADADRLLSALKDVSGGIKPRVDLEVLGRIPSVLRRAGYRSRCTLGKGFDGNSMLVDVRDPASPSPLGLALDLGTSRISFEIIDMVSGEVIAQDDLVNPQSEIAADVLARAHHASEKPGLEQLQALVVEGINSAVARTCKRMSLAHTDVVLVAIAANTTMTQLLLGLDSKWLIREPYTPVVNSPGLFRCSDIGFDFSSSAGLMIFPNVGAYFGGDLISGILCSGLYKNPAISVLVDVGTNAEVVLGNSDWLVACAGAAGPALESGVAKIGMLAGEGVIDRVWLDEDSGELEYGIIGKGKPRGICGSGIIDLAACMFRAGMIDMQGKLVAAACGNRYRQKQDTTEFVLICADESATGEDLSIDERELESLKKAKAAMYTILETITSSVGIGLQDVERFYVAGSFGSLINTDSAIAIGMIPDLPRSNFSALGNSSLRGAVSLLRDPSLVDDVVNIRDKVTYLELNVNHEFMTRFNAAQFFPHTDPSLFPSVNNID